MRGKNREAQCKAGSEKSTKAENSTDVLMVPCDGDLPGNGKRRPAGEAASSSSTFIPYLMCQEKKTEKSRYRASKLQQMKEGKMKGK